MRLVAYSVWYEIGNWFADVGFGVVLFVFVFYLGKGFLFDQSEYELDWENFVPPGGGPSGSMQLGVVLTSSNARLTNTLIESLVGKGPFFVIGGKLTYVIVGPDGSM